jgi:hypothetical protein
MDTFFSSHAGDFSTWKDNKPPSSNSFDLVDPRSTIVIGNGDTAQTAVNAFLHKPFGCYALVAEALGSRRMDVQVQFTEP